MTGGSETAAVPMHSATPPSTSARSSTEAFATPSFVSPMPVATAASEQLHRTLSGGMKRKKQKRKLDRELQLAGSENSASAAVSRSNSNNSTTSGLVKSKKHKLSSLSTPTMDARLALPIKQKTKVRDGTQFTTPQRSASATTTADNATDKRVKKPLQDISNNSSNSSSSSARAAAQSSPPTAASSSMNTSASPRKIDVPTRKLDFTATPDKHASASLSPPMIASATTAQKPHSRAEDAEISVGPVISVSANEASSSESGSGSDDSSSDSGYSSDEAEVAFDAVTLGNTRVVREAESPLSSTSTTSSSMSSLRPVGLEYRFSVASTVSSIAVAPNGQFLVVGFYNGTIYLYPLTKDSIRCRSGVLLDHITARGMYTQLMVRVALPDDGKFIFAGVYRGSTEIRAFEVDSIAFPSTASSTALTRRSTKDDNDDSDDDDDNDGVPHAHAVTHTFSDPKLKGFGAVKSVLRSKTTGATEYHLLCGLGIKNVHLWRFFQRGATKTWSWECVFDKQANGISLEFLAFHPSAPYQIISKSEHQNIRVWTLTEELHDDDFTSVTLAKSSHVDVKNTADTTAVYGDYAYGGSESLALIDLRSANRLELDLPLSTKEQQAQLDAAAANKQSSTRITASMRQRTSRRRGAPTGADDLGGMRHMRTVSQVAGRASAPFMIGMCSDGSVFVHQPQRGERALGMATPLEYVEGYERFFQDPSLSFQAQFSDLTRVNTSGLLAVLPLPATEREDWMIVAANQDQLLVRSLKAFLSRNEQVIEHARVKRGLQSVMRDLGRGGRHANRSDASSSSDSNSNSNSNSSSESDSEDEEILIEKSVLQSLLKPAAIATIAKTSDASAASLGAPASASSSSSSGSKESRDAKRKVERSDKAERVKVERDGPNESKLTSSATAIAAITAKDRKKASASVSADTLSMRSSLEVLSEQAATQKSTAAAVAACTSQEPLIVTTPKRKSANSSNNSNSSAMPSSLGGAASPVVSVSSLSSGTSNPNTPEAHARLSQREKQLLVLKDIEWTPPPKAPSSSSASTSSAAAVTVALAKTKELRESDSAKTTTASDSRTSKQRTKALFAATADDDDDDTSFVSGEAVLPSTNKSSVDAAVAKPKKPSSKAKSSVVVASTTKTVKQQLLSGAKQLETSDATSANALKTSPAATGSNKRAPNVSARKDKTAKKRSGNSKDSVVAAIDASVAVAADSTTSAAAPDVEMVDNADIDENENENDVDVDADLEMLEATEPEFVTMPLVRSGDCSLLAASLFQFEHASSNCRSTTASSSRSSDIRVLDEQAALLLGFAEQTARLKRNFDCEKQRIYEQLDCACASSSSSLMVKKKGSDVSCGSALGTAATAFGRPNWKKALSGDFLKRKQLKRRQKKQLALRLRQLHGCYRTQVHELLAVQKLQANALTARQQFNAVYEQLCASSCTEREAPLSSVFEAVSVPSEPQPLAVAFPYPSLLASLSPSRS